jgi:hypothetical protein
MQVETKQVSTFQFPNVFCPSEYIIRHDVLSALVHHLDQLFELRELHLFRQEMQLVVKVMQEYISHQIVDVTWQEFQNALSKHVHNVDELHQEHNKYLDNALFRYPLFFLKDENHQYFYADPLLHIY